MLEQLHVPWVGQTAAACLLLTDSLWGPYRAAHVWSETCVHGALMEHGSGATANFNLALGKTELKST